LRVLGHPRQVADQNLRENQLPGGINIELQLHFFCMTGGNDEPATELAFGIFGTHPQNAEGIVSAVNGPKIQRIFRRIFFVICQSIKNAAG